jgi:hypothetical protein
MLYSDISCRLLSPLAMALRGATGVTASLAWFAKRTNQIA